MSWYLLTFGSQLFQGVLCKAEELYGVPDKFIVNVNRIVGVGRDIWGSFSPTPCQGRVT